jgi:hypothetical protein
MYAIISRVAISFTTPSLVCLNEDIIGTSRPEKDDSH